MISCIFEAGPYLCVTGEEARGRSTLEHYETPPSKGLQWFVVSAQLKVRILVCCYSGTLQQGALLGKPMERYL